MLFKFECPACGGRVKADSSFAGSMAECPHCGTPVGVPYPQVGPGATLGGFRIEKLLGRGGMGQVFLATQLSMERQVALKILPSGFAENEDAVARFLHEVRNSARLNHPNIVVAHEAGEDDGIYYLAMAFVDGESLDVRLARDGALPEAEALRVVRTVAEALGYAWEKHQLLHRDIKPANIMIDRDGRVQLMDLGLSRSLSEDSGLTLSGAILGTPHYMSPEQARGGSDLTVQTDIYSLGATLYHLATGTLPFDGASAMSVLTQHLTAPLPPPRERNPSVSAACAHLIEIMMAKEPAGRHPSWLALIADIDRVLDGEEPALARPAAGASAVLPGRTEARAAVEQAVLARRAQAALQRRRQAQGNPRQKPKAGEPGRGRGVPSKPVLAAVAAIVVLVLAIGIVAARRNGGKHAATSVARQEGSPDSSDVSDRSDQIGAATGHVTRPVALPADLVPVPDARYAPLEGLAAGSREARESQRQAVERLGLPLEVRTAKTGIRFRLIPAGTFTMGSPKSEQDAMVETGGAEREYVARENPQHRVTLTEPFYCGTYEVTQAQWEAVMGENPSKFQHAGADAPVEQVSWEDCQEFCKRLCRLEGIPEGTYSLLTEAQWEYACRAGTETALYNGPIRIEGTNNASDLDTIAWYGGNSGVEYDGGNDSSGWPEKQYPHRKAGTHPVGGKAPNAFGLHDMIGNVWEWCGDWYDEYPSGAVTDPSGPGSGSYRVIRGGSGNDYAFYCRSVIRDWDPPGIRYDGLGLRLRRAAPSLP